MRAPENTVEAIRLAFAEGAHGVEIDVRATADGVLVLSHDPEVPGAGRIATTRFAALRRRRPDLPTLEEALAAVPPHGFVDVEIKSEPHRTADVTAGLVAPVLATIDAAAMAGRVVVTSFDPSIVAAARRGAPHMAVGQLLTAAVDPLVVIPWLAGNGLDAIAVPVASLTGSRLDAVVAAAHGAGMAVIAWTVDDPDLVRTLATGGVDVIVTNDPLGAIDALASTLPS